MIERTLWHPVVASETLAVAAAPRAARLLDEDLVLWRGADGTPRAWADRCPHRGARLTLGRIVACDDGERLECAYHGWQFNAAGACRRIPAMPEFKPPSGHRATVYETRESCGLVWVRLAPAETALPRFDGESDPDLRKLLCGPYEVEASAPRIVENFLDLAHFGFVHEGWLGDRAHTELDGYALTATPDGFVASGCRAWQPQSNRLAERGRWVDYRYELTAVYSAVLTKLPREADGQRDEIALFVCPREPERSTVWFRLAVTDTTSSDAQLRAFQDTIFAQDRPVLESQTPKRLPLGGGELHCAADRSSTAYRRLLIERGIRFGVC
jgi:phenylpropionate dioxygenase-like ring-hydroxylating dioxygenase large terminal subunit